MKLQSPAIVQTPKIAAAMRDPRGLAFIKGFKHGYYATGLHNDLDVTRAAEEHAALFLQTFPDPPTHYHENCETCRCQEPKENSNES